MAGRGSYYSPFDLQTALVNSGNILGVSGWGKELLLTPGLYSGEYVVYPTMIGDLQTPIIIRSLSGNSRINGSIFIHGKNLIIRDLEIFDADFINRESAYTDSAPPDIPIMDGFKFLEDCENIKIINCVIHDTRQGILSVSSAKNAMIYGCLIYHVGWNASNRGHGHGIYFSSNGNSGEGVTIKDCIVHDTFGFGLHGYGSPPATEFYQELDGNIVFQSGVLAGYPQTNILIGGVSGCYCKYSTIKNNMTYFSGTQGNNSIGYASTGPYESSILDNVFVGGQHSIFSPDNSYGIIMTGNKLYGPVGGTQLTQANFPSNEFYLSGVPDLVIVRPNDYQVGRANIAIYNGSLADSVVVDLSNVPGISAGDSVNVRNTMDYFTDIVMLLVSEQKTVTVDMRSVSHTVAIPQGWTAPETTFPAFGCFVIEK